MLENNIIEPSASPWSSPVVIVPKSDGSARFCTDFRKVNAITKGDSQPIPLLSTCINEIGDAKFLTTIDMMKGYWSVPLTERAREISAFCTPDGLYQYKVMPFGMKNSGATYQRMINFCLKDLPDVRGYIDDILIFSQSWSNHIESIKSVFSRLQEANLTVNLAKTDFCKAKVIYLGHEIGQGSVAPTDAKINCINEFPVPENVKQLQRFLGMVGFYRNFCNNFSFVANPLTNLLKKSVPFKWSTECDQAFLKLKTMMCNKPVLITPDFNKPFKLFTDASDFSVAAVLCQDDSQGIEHPVSYFSRKLDCHQRNYSTVEKEMLAIVLALKHFDVYVDNGKPITIFSDHNPLVFLNKIKDKNRRLLSWSLLLQEYDLTVVHIKGRDNVVADALSRI